ncbi:MAG TPA: RsiV family protein, partial [Pyrinomonadaceae bacterium]
VEMEHHVTHKVVYASDDVVSVLFYVTGYSAPAAHGYHFPVTLNFDLSAGREIELSRVFRPGSGYLSRITKLCDEDLRRQFGGHLHGQMTGLEGGLKPRAKNFRSWVVTPGGLVFIFGEYEVASYADGEPKVLIPFDSLREIIDPRGALARLAAHQ